jgi:hypothetical protein
MNALKLYFWPPRLPASEKEKKVKKTGQCHVRLLNLRGASDSGEEEKGGEERVDC